MLSLSSRLLALAAVCTLVAFQPRSLLAEEPDYADARGNPIHFAPLINSATDEQCLACHRETLERKPLHTSPAGLQAKDSLAWYQMLDTYEGEQETFHRRHMATPLAKRLMNMRCTTCHQGSDYREEAPVPPKSDVGFTLRKAVDPDICLMCHGQFPYKSMNLPGPWAEIGDTMNNDCLSCHAVFRTSRHNVNYLNAAEIETAGAESGDSCYGCHGGRAWYRISYPYPRHPWPTQSPVVPEWAKDRPVESDPRFLE